MLVLQRGHLFELDVIQRLEYFLAQQLLYQVDKFDDVRVLVRLLLVVEAEASLLQVRAELPIALFRKFDVIWYLAELFQTLGNSVRKRPHDVHALLGDAIGFRKVRHARVLEEETELLEGPLAKHYQSRHQFQCRIR